MVTFIKEGTTDVDSFVYDGEYIKEGHLDQLLNK